MRIAKKTDFAILKYMKTSLKNLVCKSWMSGVVAVVAQAMFAISVRAASQGTPITGIAVTDVDTFVSDTICTVANYMFWFLITLSVVFVLIAAYKYLASSGDEQKVSSATKTITFAAVAIVVALIARGFPTIIASIFNVGAGSTC
jgi:hypothetical protein